MSLCPQQTEATRAPAEVPESVEGLSMVKAMRDPSEKVRKRLFFGYTEHQRAIKDGQYKLIESHADEQRNSQLFDLVNDPWEMTNLIQNPAHQDRVDQMRHELRSLAEEWDDLDSQWGECFWGNMEPFAAPPC